MKSSVQFLPPIIRKTKRSKDEPWRHFVIQIEAMKLAERLDRLDELTGLARLLDRERGWRRRVRFWWLAPVGFVLYVANLAYEFGFGSWTVTLLFLAFFVFVAGHFYGQRLQQLGKDSSLRIFRKPRSVEDELHN